MNSKDFAVVVAGGLVTYFLWEKWLRPILIEGEDGDAANMSMNSSTGGAGGAGAGSGGAGGAGGAGAGSDYAALAAAVAALAAGTALPNIQSVTVSASTGDNELVPGEGGKRICVLAYAVSGAGTFSANFRSGGNPTNLWGFDLAAAAGNTGANMATGWPGYLFATSTNDALKCNVTGPAKVCVTYWKENG